MKCSYQIILCAFVIFMHNSLQNAKVLDNQGIKDTSGSQNSLRSTESTTKDTKDGQDEISKISKLGSSQNRPYGTDKTERCTGTCRDKSIAGKANKKTYEKTYNILILSAGGPSMLHGSVLIGEELVKRGHQVHFVLPQGIESKDKYKRDGINIITYSHPDDQLLGTSSRMARTTSEYIFNTKWTLDSPNTSEFLRVYHDECVNMMSDELFLQELKSQKFDISIVFPNPAEPCHLVIPYHLGIPFIVWSIYIPAWFIRVPELPSVFPAMILHVSKDMNYFERLLNFFAHLYLHSLYRVDTPFLHKYHSESLSYGELFSKAEFFIITADHVLDWPAVTMPNYIRLPGITTRPGKPLPSDIQHIADTALSGIIVLSFGSYGGFIPETVLFKFLEAFAGLEQTVFLRHSLFPNTLTDKISSNVHIMKWLPQNDLLAHPNVKVFITHCGNNGQHEALYHGVPMLSMPLQLDQFHNALRVEFHGYGVRMDIMSFTSNELTHAILELINNNTYRENIKRASLIIRDRPMLPKEEFAYWTEHILKFGSSHLKTMGTKLSMIQFFCLDILFTGFVILLVVILVLYFVFKYIINSCCYKKLKVKVP